jgi:hypothetical protein
MNNNQKSKKMDTYGNSGFAENLEERRIKQIELNKMKGKTAEEMFGPKPSLPASLLPQNKGGKRRIRQTRSRKNTKRRYNSKRKRRSLKHRR